MQDPTHPNLDAWLRVITYSGIMLGLISLLMLAGCDVYQASVTTLDDQGQPTSVISGSRTKFLHDSDLQGFRLVSPSGWEVGIDQSTTQAKDEALLRLIGMLEKAAGAAPVP